MAATSKQPPMFNSPRQQRPSFNSAPSATPWNPLAFHSDIEPSPWSTAPSDAPFLSPPPPPPPPPAHDPQPSNGNPYSHLTKPYLDALESIDPEAKGRDGISVTALTNVLRAGALKGADIEKITDLVSSQQSRISRDEFFLAMIFVGLSQASLPLTLEEARSRLTDPPALHLTLRSPSLTPTRTSPGLPTNSSLDPWSSLPIPTPSSPSSLGPTYPSSFLSNTEPNPLQRKGLLAIPNWYDRPKAVGLKLANEKEGKGFFWKWNVFEVESEGKLVRRRYSDFVWLEDCLLKKYPLRMHLTLPPKRVGADSAFLEQRRKALSRYLNFVVNHPIVGSDWLVGVFLKEEQLDGWRKKTQINLDEESKGRKLTERESMEAPHDLEDKLLLTRRYLPSKLHAWTTLTALYDRQTRRFEAIASDYSRFSTALGSAKEAGSASWKVGEGVMPVGEGDSQRWSVEPGEVDLLGEGVGRGLECGVVGWSALASRADKRSREMANGTLEAFKTQRDLFHSFRDLFTRYDLLLSQDPTTKLEKRIGQTKAKMSQVQHAKKAHWEIEVDRLRGLVEGDQSALENWEARKGAGRAIMWYELAFVMYPREHALVTKAMQSLVAHEVGYSRDLVAIWERLEGELEEMPLE